MIEAARTQIREATAVITRDLGFAGEGLQETAAAAFVHSRDMVHRAAAMSFSDGARFLMIRHNATPRYMGDALVLALLAELQDALAGKADHAALLTLGGA